MADDYFKDSADDSFKDSADDSWVKEGDSLFAESGVYVLTGSDADLINGMSTIVAGSGIYVLTGSDVDLISPKFIEADSGAYVLTGSDADLINPKFIIAEPGAYVLTGSDIQFNRIDADTGVYTLTGSDVDFIIGLGPTVPGVPVYLFTLTGAPDSTTDIEIPLKSIQARLRSGSPTYLQVVIPGMDYATQINDRPNGVMEIDLAYLIGGEYTNRETIIQANLEDIRIDKGSINKSISLSGHKQKTFVKKSITLDGATYKNTLSGDIRYRLAEPNVYLNPGDSVTIDADTFDANVISYFISARRTTMELAES